MNSNSSLRLLLTGSLVLAVFGASGATLRLREAVSSVTMPASPEGRGPAAAPEAAITAGQSVRTGDDARAEFVTGKAVLRLGSQTTLHVAESGEEFRLEKGTALFDGKESRLVVRLDNEPVVIEGGIGFAIVKQDAEGRPATLHVGNLSGRTTVRRGGDSLVLAPAQVLSLTTGGRARVGAFNLAKQLESSTLVHGFKSPLPGSKSLERESARFASLQRRGFVQTESLPEAGAREESVRQLVDGRNTGIPGQVAGVGLSGQPGAAGQLGPAPAGFGFQSRIAVIAREDLRGNNGLGGGVDPNLPGWANPRNPHFGSPQNDPPAPGNPGRGRIHRN